MIYMLYSLYLTSVFFIPLYVFDVISFFILDSKNSYMCLYELHFDLKRTVFSSVFRFSSSCVVSISRFHIDGVG